MQQPVEKLFIEIEVPDEVRFLHRAFTARNSKLYGVGGFVRDKVTSVVKGTAYKPKDFDLVTGERPGDVQDILHNAQKLPDAPHMKIREVGKSFGVVLVTINDKDFEIATFREDAPTGDGRRPDYVTFSTIDKDAARRDLTVNALYYDFDEKVILDFHGGIRDLHSGYVRFVGNAHERIGEDMLRMLRFVRFHCRVNAGGPESVDKNTRDVIRQCKLRPVISEERIRDEFVKGLTSCLDLGNYLRILDDMGLLAQVFPDMKTTTDVKDPFLPVEGLVAQILRYNEENLRVHNQLLKLKWTRDECEAVAFLLSLTRWKPDLIVEFKNWRKRTKLDDAAIKGYASNYCGDLFSMICAMLEYPYPTVSSEAVMAEGFQGVELGLELKRRESENFKEWANLDDEGLNR